jgi:hypothetical protein
VASRRRTELAAAVAGLAALAACDAGSATTVASAGPESTEVRLDGELAEPMWNRATTRGVFVDHAGAIARPYSEVRAFARADAIYLALYAADEDIRSTDHFDVALGGLHVSLYANGRSSDPRVRVAVERDGTLDQSSDDDEEWVIEAAVPRSALDAPPWSLDAARCDVTLAGHERCGAWQGAVQASP